MFRTVFALIAACSLLAACGGSGGESPPVPTVTTPIQALGDNTNMITYSAFGPGTDPVVGSSDDLWLGQTAFFDVRARVFLRFDLAEIPASARIVSARLEVVQHSTGGTPYDELGYLMVDHVDIPGALQDDHWADRTLRGDFAVLSGDPAPGLRSLDVTALVQSDIAAGRRTTGLRLRFEDELTFAATHWAEILENPGTGDVPTLIVTYQLP